MTGYRFGDLDGLVPTPRRLVADPAARDAMSQAAEAAAERFSWDRFVERVRAEVAALPRGA